MRAREKRRRRKARLERGRLRLESAVDRAERENASAADWQVFVDELAARDAASQSAFLDEGP